MPELRLISLDETLTRAQMRSLHRQLQDLGVEEVFDAPEEEVDLEEILSEEILTDFMDRLDAHDVSCTIFLPVEFEGRITIGDHRVGSAHALLEVLEELREELGLEENDEDEEDEEESEPEELTVIEEHLQYAWRAFFRSASSCIEKQNPPVRFNLGAGNE